MKHLDLTAKANQEYVALKERRRKRYRLAKDLGFNAKEAKILSAYSQAHIIEMARERDAKSNT